MAKDPHNLAVSFETEHAGGLLSGLLADEDEFDRRMLWRLGSWAAASVGAVVIALLANQTSIGMRREQIASTDLARQSQQVQESRSEARRLASAIETLNSDRDRLYSRVGVLEQGLDSVTGAIARQNPTVTPPQAGAPNASPAPAAALAPGSQALALAEPPAPAPKPLPAPAVSSVAATTAVAAEKPPAVANAADSIPAPTSSGPQTGSTIPAATSAVPLIASKSMMAPPDPAAVKLFEPSAPPKVITAAPMPELMASTPPAEEEVEADAAEAVPKLAVRQTEFGVDVGGANSIAGLRALWRGLVKTKSNAALASLSPIIVIKENNNGLGMQLRLVAGPITDAAAAAKICASMIQNDRACTTTVFEAQRLAMNAGEPAASAADAKPAPEGKPGLSKRIGSKRSAKDDPAQKPAPPSSLSSFFGRQ
jgi:hypothetical protein